MIGYVKYYALVVNSDIVYAILDKYEIVNDSPISNLEGGKHIVPVRKRDCEDIKPADKLTEKLCENMPRS